nr:hypothetical protein [Bacillus bingmayongensis]
MRNNVDYSSSVTFSSKVLCFYDSPSWQDKDVAGFVDEGLGFVIDVKVSMSLLTIEFKTAVGKFFIKSINNFLIG